MADQFFTPPKIIMGENALEAAGNYIRTMGRKALIVCGPVVKKIGIAGKVAAVLEKYDISYVIFAGITDEPTDQMVEEGTKIY